LAVGVNPLTWSGRVNLADGLDRLRRAKRFSSLKLCSGLGHLHKDNVAQLMLRVVSNPDRGQRAFHADPLVFLGVAIILRIRHQSLLRNRSRSSGHLLNRSFLWPLVTRRRDYLRLALLSAYFHIQNCANSRERRRNMS